MNDHLFELEHLDLDKRVFGVAHNHLPSNTERTVGETNVVHVRRVDRLLPTCSGQE